MFFLPVRVWPCRFSFLFFVGESCAGAGKGLTVTDAVGVPPVGIEFAGLFKHGYFLSFKHWTPRMVPDGLYLLGFILIRTLRGTRGECNLWQWRRVDTDNIRVCSCVINVWGLCGFLSSFPTNRYHRKRGGLGAALSNRQDVSFARNSES